MSRQPAPDPEVMPGACDGLEAEIIPRTRDLGGFSVRRVLPAARRQMVGPFIFFDQMGPAALDRGQGIDVRPHPHIGLATVTYLFEGEMLHRDSLGTVQTIRPGALNWMHAGRGIVHSERTPPESRQGPSRLSGIQSWVALPDAAAESDPAFVHHGADQLPVVEGEGLRVRIIAGALFGRRSPVVTASELFYGDAVLGAGAVLPLPRDQEERAIYIAEGTVELAGEIFTAGRLLVFRPGADIALRARGEARVLMLGGAAFSTPRFIWWNFVAGSRERIEQAKSDWQAERFPPVPGDDERIPLPS